MVKNKHLILINKDEKEDIALNEHSFRIETRLVTQICRRYYHKVRKRIETEILLYSS